MAPKFISFPVFAIFLFACLSLLARASPIPIVLPPSEGITLFKDAVADSSRNLPYSLVIPAMVWRHASAAMDVFELLCTSSIPPCLSTIFLPSVLFELRCSIPPVCPLNSFLPCSLESWCHFTVRSFLGSLCVLLMCILNSLSFYFRTDSRSVHSATEGCYILLCIPVFVVRLCRIELSVL
ncbi:hypothetical protein EDD22DRAFT_272786 [Suillus occidentalis]|nr:hypothetical protein EDD22DRAFT_272786 [Suillus occidentalis]